MSLASSIKDFTDVLEHIYTNHLVSFDRNEVTSAISDILSPSAIPRTLIIQQALLHFVKSIVSGITYLLTFQWFKDFSYLPLLAPNIFRFSSPMMPSLGEQSGLFSDTFTEEPLTHLFSFSNIQLGEQHPLFAGLVNSFFFSLPFSLPQLVTLRRLFSQGLLAAGASIIGTVVAHSLFLLGVVYGLRFLIIPYLSFQPITFIIGLATIVVIINELVQEKRMYLTKQSFVRLTPTQKTTNKISFFLRIGILNFLLAISEETTLFHALNNFTLHTQNSYLQFYKPLALQGGALSTATWFNTQNTLHSFISVTTYLVTFIVGHCIFSFGFCYLFLKITEGLCSFTGWTLPRIAHRINRFILLLIVAFTFASFPYYGLDYLFIKMGGFLPEDPLLRNTIFSPTLVKAKNTHFKSRAPAKKNEKTPFELDLNYFDRGIYLNAPKQEKEALSSASYKQSQSELQDLGKATLSLQDTVKPPSFNLDLSFEELNYQGEYAWLMRNERLPQVPENEKNGKSKLFQKPRKHFKELKLKKENKQAEAALKERIPIGHLPKVKEGRLPGGFIETSPFSNKNQSLKESTKNISLEKGKSNTSGSNSSLKEDNFQMSRPSQTKVPFIKSSLPVKDVSDLRPITPGERSRGESFPIEAKLSPLPPKGGHGLQASLVQGHEDTYDSESSLLEKKLSLELEVESNYSKSFVSNLSEEASNTPTNLLPIENIIQKRYLLNPLYRSLLKVDIDTFLRRQPNEYKLAQNQEYSLFQKRQLLEKYYNWLRYYSPLENSFQWFKSNSNLDPHIYTVPFYSQSIVNPRTESGGALYPKFTFRKTITDLNALPKSFVDTLYHQQFKGTLNKVERLFKVTFDSQQNPKKERILSYDQILYKNGRKNFKKEEPLAEHPSLHEELFLSTKNENLNPFIEESNTTPVYAGWDDQRRSFVITNKFGS